MGVSVYGVCDNNCKHPVYTREQALSILQQAINDGTLQNIDADFAAIKKVVDQNGGNDVSFWIGTEAQFNALETKPVTKHFIPRRGENGVVYICLDDSAIAALPTEPLSIEEIRAICGGTAAAYYDGSVTVI